MLCSAVDLVYGVLHLRRFVVTSPFLGQMLRQAVLYVDDGFVYVCHLYAIHRILHSLSSVCVSPKGKSDFFNVFMS